MPRFFTLNRTVNVMRHVHPSARSNQSSRKARWKPKVRFNFILIFFCYFIYSLFIYFEFLCIVYKYLQSRYFDGDFSTSFICPNFLKFAHCGNLAFGKKMEEKQELLLRNIFKKRKKRKKKKKKKR